VREEHSKRDLILRLDENRRPVLLVPLEDLQPSDLGKMFLDVFGAIERDQALFDELHRGDLYPSSATDRRMPVDLQP